MQATGLAYASFGEFSESIKRRGVRIIGVHKKGMQTEFSESIKRVSWRNRWPLEHQIESQ